MRMRRMLKRVIGWLIDFLAALGKKRGTSGGGSPPLSPPSLPRRPLLAHESPLWGEVALGNLGAPGPGVGVDCDRPREQRSLAAP